MTLSKTFEEYRSPRKGEYLVIPEHMISQGEDAVPLLCELLESPRLRTRILAAQKLREVGDERAVGPLCRVLEQYAGAVSPWVKGVGRLLLLGLLGAVTALITLICALTLGWTASVYRGAMLFSVIEVIAVVCILRDMFDAKPMEQISARWRDAVATFGGHDLLVRTVVDALAATADRCPINAVRQSLPMLRQMAGDAVRHRRGTRQAAARAAARINVSTANCRRLPIASLPPQPTVINLLLPAGNLNQET